MTRSNLHNNQIVVSCLSAPASSDCATIQTQVFDWVQKLLFCWWNTTTLNHFLPSPFDGKITLPVASDNRSVIVGQLEKVDFDTSATGTPSITANKVFSSNCFQIIGSWITKRICEAFDCFVQFIRSMHRVVMSLANSDWSRRKCGAVLCCEIMIQCLRARAWWKSDKKFSESASAGIHPILIEGVRLMFCWHPTNIALFGFTKFGAICFLISGVVSAYASPIGFAPDQFRCPVTILPIDRCHPSATCNFVLVQPIKSKPEQVDT